VKYRYNSEAREEYRDAIHFTERLQNDSSMRSNLLFKEFGMLRPNLENSNPEFALAEYLIFLRHLLYHRGC
jgi:hypothetical protein